MRVGVTAGRFSPKIRPNRFLGFSRGFHFLVNEKKMSTENPTEAQLVDYDEADEVTVNEAPIQEEEDADARK